MRYHKVTAITEAEADFIIKTPSSSLNECVVIEHFGKWYDVRRMTDKELTDFCDDLNRSRLAELRAGLLNPH
jgi:hypothetical protein